MCAAVPKDTVDMLIEHSLEDGGEYVNKCTGIVGIVFRVEEVSQADFDAKEKLNITMTSALRTELES